MFTSYYHNLFLIAVLMEWDRPVLTKQNIFIANNNYIYKISKLSLFSLLLHDPIHLRVTSTQHTFLASESILIKN